MVLSLIAGTPVSTIFAVQAHQRALGEADAKADALEKLRASYLAEARARRFSGRIGQRFAALEAIAKAVKWGSELIAAATCCHHHLQTQLQGSDGARGAFAAVRRQGLLRERLGDVLTDAFRWSFL